MTTPAAGTTEPRVVSCELCVVGAGIAGLNALFAASRHLSSRDKIVLVDSAPQAGGMWLGTYEYVRLHQPHPFFTAGNLAWDPPKDPSYLATRGEVVAHLQSCLATLRKCASLEEYFGHSYESHSEATNGTREVLVRCSPSAPGATPLLVKAKKLIKAIATNIKPKEPLPLSSTQVRSLSPNRHDLFGDEVRKSDAPIYVVGGGKTGMDTAHALITRLPGRKVRCVIGAGTLFTNRDKAFPVGLKRWVTPTTTLEAFLDLARLFDGSNEEAVLERFRSNYALGLDDQCRRFMFGTLSTQENDAISKGLDGTIRDYLTDVVDRGGVPTMMLRSGESRPVEPGSLFVNCTGYIGRERVPYEPFVSESGNVVSIQGTSVVHLLSSMSAYFLTHLSYLNLLQKLPLYEVDFPEMSGAAKEALLSVMVTHLLYNAGTIVTVAPSRVMNECGLDLERWYPIPRRLLAVVRFLRFLKKNPDHFRRNLDTVRERFGVRCGPLPWVRA